MSRKTQLVDLTGSRTESGLANRLQLTCREFPISIIEFRDLCSKPWYFEHETVPIGHSIRGMINFLRWQHTDGESRNHASKKGLNRRWTRARPRPV